MESKGADLIVVNDVSRSDIGFDSSENEILLITREGGTESVSRRSKRDVADRIWDAVLRLRTRSSQPSVLG
jgi:phosphopantothenoylcysteine decarboxylase/phosphopantothenate--cysteine ligase